MWTRLMAGGAHRAFGVPCSSLENTLSELRGQSGFDYVPCSVEGEAVAAAAGVWLGGGRASVWMQNSGLGNAVNPIASLLLPYDIPALLVISWRGEPGTEDAPHHGPMGKSTVGLLDLFGIPWRFAEETGAADDAMARVERGQVAALIVRRSGGRSVQQPVRPERFSAGRAVRFGSPSGAALSRERVLAVFACGVRSVATTGLTARVLGAKVAKERGFPMQGSMGFAAAIGLGIALQSPDQPVFVFDGDGAAIMRLGTMATVGHQRPSSFAHIVFDDGVYASTGGQPSASAAVSFPDVALACGYAAAAELCSQDGLSAACDWLNSHLGTGPLLLSVRTAQETALPPRPKIALPEVAAAFRGAQCQ